MSIKLKSGNLQKKYMNHMKSSGYIIWKKFWQKNKINFRKIIFWTQENLFLRENIHSWCELLCTILCMFDLWSLASLYLGHWRPEQSATSSYTSVCVFIKFNSNYMQLLLHLTSHGYFCIRTKTNLELMITLKATNNLSTSTNWLDR